MDNRTLLNSVIEDFSPKSLSDFFRSACGSFRPGDRDYNHYLNPDLPIDSLHEIGHIRFPDEKRLIVITGRMQTELTSRSGKKDQYDLAKKILKDELYDAGIFAFFDHQGNFRFSLVVVHYHGQRRTFSNYRRYTYFVSPHTPNRTFLDQIGTASFESIDAVLEAFSVEVVTKEFFQIYEQIFREAEASISLDWDAEQKRLYTQRFFNRLMFLAFLERKGWLIFDERSDYLLAMFEDYWHHDPDKRPQANFHRKRLNALFFWGLNNPRGDERDRKGYESLRDLIGQVPYLNGGLFEREADDETWFFPDEIAAKILKDLVYRFNFTVAESTPMDVEVAVDPEMLGKIFEELVTGRHESGSYYTPKPVVSFMCREAIKGYLKTGLSNEQAEAVERFVDETDPTDLRDPEAALTALRSVKACDPACGSGAYLLGLLHELLDLRAALFVSRNVDAQTVYERKLEIIQNNLYGVDIDPFAVNIARLRLWLSLIVDYEGDDPPPLPNLDFKIEAGDSLTTPDPSGGLDLGFRRELVKAFIQAKTLYATAHHDEKRELFKKINKLREDIRSWSGRKDTSVGFDWLIEFAEVFVNSPVTQSQIAASSMLRRHDSIRKLKPGFDIVLANPPYVRADAQFKHIDEEHLRQKAITEWKDYRKTLKKSKIYKTLYEKWDLYIPFLERAYQIAREEGDIVFIISDAFNVANYTEKSHEFLLENSIIERLDFCSEIDLFDAGVHNTIIHFSKARPNKNYDTKRVRRWGDCKNEFESNIKYLNPITQVTANRLLFRKEERLFLKTDKYTELGNICYISTGLRPWRKNSLKETEKFVTEDVVQELQDSLHPKPWVESKDISKWIVNQDKYLEWGTPRAPAQFESKTFPELYEAQEKLLTKDISQIGVEVAYDEEQLVPSHTAYCCVPWHYLKNVMNSSISKTSKYKHQDPLGDREEREKISKKFSVKFLLCIMNSGFAKLWMSKNSRSKLHIYPNDWKSLPIPKIPIHEQKSFIEKVDAILGEYDKFGDLLPVDASERVTKLENELNEMVDDLYEVE